MICIVLKKERPHFQCFKNGDLNYRYIYAHTGRLHPLQLLTYQSCRLVFKSGLLVSWVLGTMTRWSRFSGALVVGPRCQFHLANGVFDGTEPRHILPKTGFSLLYITNHYREPAFQTWTSGQPRSGRGVPSVSHFHPHFILCFQSSLVPDVGREFTPAWLGVGDTLGCWVLQGKWMFMCGMHLILSFRDY